MKREVMPVLPSAPLASLNAAHGAFVRRYPGDSGRRQPVHVVYGGAHRFAADTAKKLGALARAALETYAPDEGTFGRALGLPPAVSERVYPRVAEKLKREPVEDFRIDFEDGYGHRADPEEDGHAVAAAEALAAGLRQGLLPPFMGLRVKPLSGELAPRALRTLELFLGRMVSRTGGVLPSHFVVTLPKVTGPEQVRALCEVLAAHEGSFKLEPGSLGLEVMVETPQCLVAPDGRMMLPQLLDAAGERLRAAHFGTYDFTAALDVTAAHQSMRHPHADLAKGMMKLAFAGTGVMLSDGATTLLPAAPHKGEKLTAKQRAENRKVVHRAWRQSASDIRHSLVNGFYQGWDLHPAQLPARFGAVYAFFLEGFDAARERLAGFVEQLGRAKLTRDVFDDAATGQGLLNFFLRGINCGAITEEDAAATGLSLEELRSKSFAAIAKARRG
ncbi:MAG: phosphoenolpyruvate kinase [Myxococcales bacterium]|nr:phosphoenolpyruvate kinase [Myxococcales bacterium]